MTVRKPSKKPKEDEVYNNNRKKRKRKPNHKMGDLVRANILRNTFSGGDAKNWSYEFQQLQKK